MSQQKRIGRYQVLEEIASGGQGAVYRARDVSLDRVVALKVLHPHLARNPQYRERFLREARTAASLTHPNVVTIYEVGEEGDQLYIAMEYLPRSLHDVLEASGSLDIQNAISMTVQVAAALQAAHEHDIVHRDIKPQNILVGPGDTYKVTDFGIARAGDLSTMTATGTVMGSPPYMSPEQVRGERADIRSDIYSLGITFFNCLTGELPFKADTPFGVLRQHTDVQPPRVRQLRPDVPRAV
ncbi:MAG: serine/threonine protein kinase, partial [Chloroflexi bacterium]|nr:serine/threonine protein kinase [Chloroflexota bacterium]